MKRFKVLPHPAQARIVGFLGIVLGKKSQNSYCRKGGKPKEKLKIASMVYFIRKPRVGR